jgi:NlpC/P60 family
MWAGVSAYGHHYKGEGARTVPTRYAVSVKNKVYNDPGYLGDVRDAVQAARESAKSKADGDTDASVFDDGGVPGGLPKSKAEALSLFRRTHGPGIGIRGVTASPSEFRIKIMAAAMWGYYNRGQIGYTQQAARGQDFGPPPNVPGDTDCSAFATWCYKSAGARDPNGLNYSWIGWTGSMVKHGQKVSLDSLNVGDLVFYGGSGGSPGHVAVYVGNGRVVSHGSEPGPLLLSTRYRSDILFAKRYL